MEINTLELALIIMLVQNVSCSTIRENTKPVDSEKSEPATKVKSELVNEMFYDDEDINALEDLLDDLEQSLYSEYEGESTDDKSAEGVGVTNPPNYKQVKEEKSDEVIEDEIEEEISSSTERFELDLADDIFDGIEEDLVEIVKENPADNTNLVIGIAIGCTVSISCSVALLVLYLVYLRNRQTQQ